MEKNLFETGNEPTEVVEESVNQNTQEETNWESKDKATEAYRNLQKKNSELDLMVKQLSEEKIRVEERARLLEELSTKQTQVQEDPEPVVPLKPIKPYGYSKADAIAYPDSDSGKYDQDKELYEEAVKERFQWHNNRLTKTLGNIQQSLEEETNVKLRNEEFARRKANKIAWLAKATGGDMKLAGEVFETVQEIMNPEKEKPEYFVTLHNIVKKNPNALKTQQAVQRSERQQFTPPGAIVQGEGENAKQEQTFVQSIGSRRRNNHGLFETEKK